MMEQQPPPGPDGMFPPGGPGPMDGPHPGMMDNPAMDPMGPPQPPMDHMGPMDGMGGMNGGMDPMGGPMDPMNPDAMMDPPYFESSEYPAIKSTGHDGTTVKPGLHRLVSRQSSSASMELDSVSVRKIEEAEDDYSKVKQALLSDLGHTQDSPLILSPLRQPDAEAEAFAMKPEFDHQPLISPSPTQPIPVTDSGRIPGAASSSSSKRSKDTLESIFGAGNTTRGLTGSAAEPAEAAGLNTTVELQSTTTTTKAESRSSYYFSTSDNSSRSLLEAEMHESRFNNLASEELHQSSNNHSNHSSTKANSKKQPVTTSVTMEAEPFPICLSPELEEMMTLHQAANTNRSVLSSPRGDVYTIPEVPEEESPTGPQHTRGTSKLPRIPTRLLFSLLIHIFHIISVIILIVQPNLYEHLE